MTKHTPGPWSSILVPISGPSAIREIESESGLRLALVGIYGTTKTPDVSECVANAHLIAAAPDLLKALKACLGPLQDAYNQSQHSGHATKAATAFVNAQALISKLTK